MTLSQWRWSVAGILALALVVGSAGIIQLPVEAHEALVLRTTQEMHDRGDWILPYCNGQPRLVKPPLNYWLTGLSAWVSGSLSAVEPWHARFPSLLAGLGLVIVTIAMGRVLFDARTALAAGLILASSLGYFTYANSARPEMLYTVFCAAGYAAFARGWRSHESGTGSAAPWIYAMWAAYGLATLTKGPHIPAVLLGSCIVFCKLQHLSWPALIRLVRPATGLALAAAIAAPWWYLVHQRIGGAGLHGTQLSGSLLIPELIPSAYYFYRPLQLILPWLLLVIPTLFLARRSQFSAPVLLLVLLTLVTTVVLSFAPQERWHYLLPILPALTLLIAQGGLSCADRLPIQRVIPANLGFVLFHGAIAVAALLWAAKQAQAPAPLVAAACALAVVLGYASYRSARAEPLAALATAAIAFAFATIGLCQTTELWNRRLLGTVRLATELRQTAGPTAPIATLSINPAVYVYYARRTVPRLESTEEVETTVAQAPGKTMVLVARTRDLARLRQQFDLSVVDAALDDRDDATSLLRLRLRPGADIARPALRSVPNRPLTE
jgi:4-amino-4-deoxy-L-arabinose transferase-like glycosyltransferase